MGVLVLVLISTTCDIFISVNDCIIYVFKVRSVESERDIGHDCYKLK